MSTSFPEATVRSADDLRIGMRAEFRREITEQDVFDFAHVSGDANPLHVNEDYAAATNFGRRIVHGAFQVGLGSALIGMYLPGRNVLLGAIQARFPSPLYYPCSVVVSGEIMSWNPANASGAMRMTVQEARSQTPTAEVHMHFGWHEQRAIPRVRRESRPLPRVPHTDAPIVVVTGAAGGVGAQVVTRLAPDYTVVAMARRPGTVEAAGSNVIELVADLQDRTWRDALRQVVDGRRVYGVVHAAWPGQPHGSLLQVDESVVRQQLNFGPMSTIELARYLFCQPDAEGSSGGRLIVLGSIAGTQKPVLPLASYSLGKTAVEHTVRLLAPELARRGITANVISPTFMAAGMNKQSTERQHMKEAATVPLGRLCQTDDVAALVKFLLSPASEFISGQTLTLTGGQL
jgi:NAD(P)-dependent dehydrogenase (short-subunit alcohol dehydrogenase family)/acyl dehydratase